MSTTNKLWIYFKRNESSATCLHCDKKLSLGSNLPKRQTFGSLKNHLHSAHPEGWLAYTAGNSGHKKSIIKSPPKKRKKPTKNIKEESGEVEFEETLPEFESLVFETLQNNAENDHDWTADDNPDVEQRIDKSIMDLLAVEMLPIELVDSVAFRSLNLGDPNRPSKYKHKNKEYFKSTLLPETYKRLRQKIISLIVDAKWISFSIHISHRSKIQSDKLLTYIAHYINGGKRTQILLGTQLIVGEGAAKTLQHLISAKIAELCCEYDIGNRLHVATMDERLCEDLPYRSYICAAMSLQSILKHVIETDNMATMLLQKCSSNVGHFLDNPQAYAKLRECQRNYDLSQIDLVQIDSERWETTGQMLERLLEQKTALTLFTVEYGNINLPTSQEWMMISELSNIFKLFQQAISELSADSACISIVIPLLAMLNTHLQGHEKELKNTQMGALKARLSALLNQRFAYVRGTVEFCLATILDPRFKAKYLTKCEVARCYAEITSSNYDCRSSSTAESHGTINNTKDLWHSHDQLATELMAEDGNEKMPLLKSVWLHYLNEPLLARNADIYGFWDSCQYSALKNIALKYLSTVPTSLPNEKLSTAAMQLYSEQNSRLNNTGEEVEKRLFLGYNIKLFNFDY